MSNQIKYKKRRIYKYNLYSECKYPTEISITPAYKGKYLELDSNGELVIKVGYAWDGPSGPTIDTKNFMRGSLVHDALYQLIREGIIEQKQRDIADKILHQICKDDGMSSIRAWWVYKAVKLFGGSSAKPDMLTAP